MVENSRLLLRSSREEAGGGLSTVPLALATIPREAIPSPPATVAANNGGLSSCENEIPQSCREISALRLEHPDWTDEQLQNAWRELDLDRRRATRQPCDWELIQKNPALFELIDQELGKRIEGECRARRAIFLFSCIRLVANKGKGAANNLLVNSASSAGKSYTTRAIVDFHPPEFVENLARASPNAFSYWKAGDPAFSWDGRLCRLTDIPDALLKSDAFKTFISDAEKSVIINKDKAGKNAAVEYEVKGKPIILACTANAEPNEEILNRFNLIQLDESEAQTKAITRRQLRQAAGKASDAAEYDRAILQAFRQLSSVAVVVPYAEALAEHLPTEVRARRDVPRIIALIQASAALHQKARQLDDEGRVIAEGHDYELAREALASISTGSFVALTRAQRRLYDACVAQSKACGLAGWTVKELLAAHPMGNKSQIYALLPKLAEKGLLSTALEKREGVFQAVLTYRVAEAGSLKGITLPPFEQLISEKLEKLEKVSEKTPEKLEKLEKVASEGGAFPAFLPFPHSEINQNRQIEFVEPFEGWAVGRRLEVPGEVPGEHADRLVGWGKARWVTQDAGVAAP